jgi:hypothetical protein
MPWFIPGGKEVLQKWHDIMRELRPDPTSTLATEILTKLLTGPWSPVVSQPPIEIKFDVEPEWEDIINDMLASGYRARLWSSAKNGMDENASLATLFANRLAANSSSKSGTKMPSYYTVLGFKATKNGVLRCRPKFDTQSIAYSNEAVHIVPEQRRSLRYLSKSLNPGLSSLILASSNSFNDYELVVSESQAFTGLHVDSSASGIISQQLLGCKVWFTCPATEGNWKLFKDYYFEGDSEHTYQTFIDLVIDLQTFARKA